MANKTISNTFVVNTVDDPVGLVAQYCATATPTQSSQIHTSFQTGDLYMRTRTTEETFSGYVDPNHPWNKIVGESGGETNYTFNISKSLTSSSATTAPANCYYSSWQDAPVAPTSTYPYLWMKIVKKTWNESTQSYDSGTASYARITGEPGTSPYFADLDNEMDSIACTHDGKAASAQSVVTHVSMFKGSSAEAFTVDKIYRNGTQMSWDGNNNGVWPRLSGGTVTLEFDSGAAVNVKDDFKITLYATNATSVTRELHFIVNGVRANAIYRLVPSHSQIVKKKDGTYVPSGNVTCSVEKTENGSTSTPSSSEYTLEKSVNGGSYTTYSATAASSITSDLKFRLKVGGVVVDLETIPLVSDGDKGNNGSNAPYVELSRSTIIYQANNEGKSTASQNFPITYALKVNGNTCTISSVNNITISLPTNVTVVSGTKTTSGCTINCAHSVSMSGVITITITGTYDGISYTATGSITVSDSREGPQGEQGEQGIQGIQGVQGKIGRFYYYAQEWVDSSNVSYSVTDSEAPFFSYNNNFWVFNPVANGTYTMASMGTPSSSSENWEIMYTDFKYIITQAIFSAFAKLGSFVISTDFFLSQYGTLVSYDGTETVINSTNYQTAFGGKIPYAWFDSTDPMAEGTFATGYRFRPTKVINALTGEEFMASGRIRVDSNGGLVVKGATMVNDVDIFKTAAYDVNNTQMKYTGKELTYKFFEASEGNVINSYTIDGETYTYYDHGEIKLKSNQLLVFSEGMENWRGRSGWTYSVEDSWMFIMLPPPQLFIGQSILITNQTYGFKSGHVVVRQAYECQGSDDHKIISFTKYQNFIQEDPSYYYTDLTLEDCCPYLYNGTGFLPVNGIWKLEEYTDGSYVRKYPVVRTEIDLTEYEWIELTAAGNDVMEYDDTYAGTNKSMSAAEAALARQRVDEFNAVWVITRWEKAQ